jgi:thiamine kinase-like enzyme
MNRIHDALQTVATAIWGGDLLLEEAVGGLFNQVVKVQSSDGIYYLKRFTDQASSGTFPPLPTTASQRFNVASSWHELATKASYLCNPVQVPEVIALHTDFHVIAMSSVEGQPLYEELKKSTPQCELSLPSLIDWLATFHELSLKPKKPLLEASAPFKCFKIDLQYTQILSELSDAVQVTSKSFINDYLCREEEPVHGDINSRNILVADKGKVAVIDFEQGHYGEGIYDLAYILCEYVIRHLEAGTSPESLLNMAWSQYSLKRKWGERGEEYFRWRIHLGFQTLYRLVGPSRKVWTGHLSAEAADSVRNWSISQLTGLLK